MAEYRLAHRVGEVADRLARLQTLRRQSWFWFAAALVGLALALANLLLPAPLLPLPLTIATGIALLVATWIAAQRPGPSLEETAREIERRWPTLDSRLVTALAQHPNEGAGGFSFLQHEVISQTLLHAHRHDWRLATPSAVLSRAKLRQMASFLAFVGSFAAAAWIAHARPASSAVPGLAGGAAGSKYRVTIEPGDTTIERGTSLLVIARFAGQTPSETVLHAADASGQTTSIPLSRSLDDPLFGGRIAQVETDLSYHLTFDGEPSDAYRVTVFDFPKLERADATIVPPEYTGLETSTIEDVRLISVVEGSELTLSCRLNKPVQSAVFQRADGSELKLEAAEGSDGLLRTITFLPEEVQRFELMLIDADGRTNKHPPEFQIDVIPNQLPELAVEFPGRDVRVSPLEEVSLEAQAQDDFGLKEYGLVYQLPGSDERSLKLGDGSGGGGAQVQLAHQLLMEDISAQPNELVSYYFYADDVGPDGEVRRTLGDMYFAEVRYFDEEFRQSQSAAGQQGGMPAGDTPSSQLLQLQRDIVSATWNLIRREPHDTPSEEFPADARTVRDSQSEAIAMGRKLQTMQEDELAREFLDEALGHMTAAESSLGEAAEQPSLEPLPEARTSAYAAYQALVKLNGREHLVQQAQASSMGQTSGNSDQLHRQLQQLELKNNRNRYETEQQAQPPADREQLQVLNRLRELARRQESLNEKIKELENALRAAQTEQERKEIERQLKRLQEEQQQMLRDLDELHDRMNNKQNRSRMADAREQAKDVRENLRQSSEALKEGQISRALAAGTRAERKLSQMKDELRNQTAGQFSDTMRELRQEARELAEQQQQLADQLAGNPEHKESGPPKLKDEDSNDLNDDFAEQRERLGQLMDKLKDVIVESETSEPLLSKTLYDAVRDTRADRPAESLEMASQFLRHGLDREAAAAESQARAGINKLREGIEEAAENVLGNEIESLRRAREEIEQLTDAVSSELDQSDPTNADAQRADEQRQRRGQSTGSEPQDSEETPSSEERTGGPSDEDKPQEQGTSGGSQPGRQPGPPNETPESDSQDPGPSQQTQPPGKSSESSESSLGGGSESERPQGDGASRSALSNFLQTDAAPEDGSAAGAGGLALPLTGADFVPWSDRMRDVEEMVDDPELRARVRQIRDRAREMRIDMKRHAKSPSRELIRTKIYGPMLELRERLAEEIARRKPNGDVVPLDRDPVPDRYAELVRQYYERLGSGR